MNTREIIEIVYAWRAIIKEKNLKAQVFSSNNYIIFDFDFKSPNILEFQREIKKKFGDSNIFIAIKIIENEPTQFAIKNTHDPRLIESFGFVMEEKNNTQVQEPNTVTLIENENHQIVVKKIEEEKPERPYNYRPNSIIEQEEITKSAREFNQEQKNYKKMRLKNKRGGIKRVPQEPIQINESMTWEEFINKRGFKVEVSKHPIYGYVIVFKTVADKNKFLGGSLLVKYKFARYESSPCKISTHFEA